MANINITEFELKEEHLKLLKASYVEWRDCECGAPSINCKRPYGNSSVIDDIAEILGEEMFEDMNGEKRLSKEQGNRLEKYHKETQYALQIILCTQSFKTGLYRISKQYDSKSWVYVGELA